jgi:peptide/nickel transport system substrate-binding protein
MRNRRKSYLFLLTLLAIAVLLGGFAPRATQAQDQEKILTIAIPGDIETLDPPFSRFQRSNETNYNVYDQFFRYGWHDSGQGYSVTDIDTIEGGSVESWDWSEDNLSIVLHIRQGVTFTKTGREMTADDFIYWFERAFGTQSGTEWNCVTAHIDDMSHVQKTGDYEVTISFSAPSPWFFYLFRDQSQAPMDAVEAQAHAATDDPWATRWLAKNDIGSGEFYVESWESGVEMVLHANPDYWDGPAYFDKVVLRIVPSSADRALLLQQGEVDIATDLSTDELDLLRQSEGVKVLSIPTRNQMVLGFNVQKAPFDNAQVRQALNYAVPYGDILNGIFRGNGLIPEGPIPVQGQLHDSSLWPYTYDLDKARELLDQAGYADGFKFTLDIPEGIPTIEQIAVLLKDSFSQVGVDMTINRQASAVFAEQLGTLDHQAWMRDLLWYVDDPGYTGVLFFRTGAVANWMGYSNPDLDQVIDELAATFDPVRKQELAQEYQRILIEDSPALYVAEMPFEIAMRDNIQGYVQLPDNLLWYYPLYRAE